MISFMPFDVIGEPFIQSLLISFIPYWYN